MARPREIRLRLSEDQRGSLRYALCLAAIAAEEQGDKREARRLDRLVEALDDAWDAARGRRRWYGTTTPKAAAAG